MRVQCGAQLGRGVVVYRVARDIQAQVVFGLAEFARRRPGAQARWRCCRRASPAGASSEAGGTTAGVRTAAGGGGAGAGGPWWAARLCVHAA